MEETQTKETFERLEKTQDDINSALVELLFCVQELRQKIEELEIRYDSRQTNK